MQCQSLKQEAGEWKWMITFSHSGFRFLKCELRGVTMGIASLVPRIGI